MNILMKIKKVRNGKSNIQRSNFLNSIEIKIFACYVNAKPKKFGIQPVDSNLIDDRKSYRLSQVEISRKNLTVD